MENPAYLPIMPPKKLLDDYSLFMKINLQLSKKTIVTYRSLLKKFFESIKKRSVSSRDITNFLDFFSSQYPSKFTYTNMLKALKVFFREYLRSDIVENFRFPVIPIIPKAIPTMEEMRIFYDAIPTLKEKALFLVYATSGLRRNEILGLLISDIDLEKRMIIPNNSHSGNTKKSWI